MKEIRLLILLFALLLSFHNCSDDELKPVPIEDSDKELPARWADMTLRVIRNHGQNSPTYISRSLGYLGVTMYESIVHGNPNYRSLVGQLNELSSLPQPETGKEYNWTIALNAGQAYMLKNLFPSAFGALEAVDSLEFAVHQPELVKTGMEIGERSRLFGLSIAEAIFEWSKSDGGHGAQFFPFDPSYSFPRGPEFWAPPGFGQTVSPYPLHPHWGNNRTFVSANGYLPIPDPVPYSTDPASECYKLFKDVYDKNKVLTEEEKRIAAWWADDPTQSFSPPGHSYNLATIAITSKKADMFVAAEAYAKVGMAVADAFINCWKCKYVYHSGRPNSYILANIDDKYAQFWPEPPFPAFTSGHATQSAATAMVLVSVFGNNFPLVDNTYEGRLPDFNNIEYRSRTFRNIDETAKECAYSRFLGGIHTQQDNDKGATQGYTIGEHIASLSWKK